MLAQSHFREENRVTYSVWHKGLKRKNIQASEQCHILLSLFDSCKILSFLLYLWQTKSLAAFSFNIHNQNISVFPLDPYKCQLCTEDALGSGEVSAGQSSQRH